MSRLFWIALGAVAVFVYLHWDEITGVIENRKTISAGAKAVSAVEELIDSGKTIWSEVTK